MSTDFYANIAKVLAELKTAGTYKHFQHLTGPVDGQVSTETSQKLILLF